jgi:GDP-mannose 6-dehydrogenase
MKVSVFGLGYVGTVTAACLARDNITVIGVDVNPEKTAMIMNGAAPIIEPGLSSLIGRGIAKGLLSATTDAARAVAATTVSLISVGTPSAADGSVDLGHLFTVCKQIGAALAAKTGEHTIIVRSTVPPGTTEQCRRVITEASGGRTVPIAFNPEFLREGCALRDYDSPPFTIIGTDDDNADKVLRAIYGAINAPVFRTDFRTAETVKYVCNTWHAAKIAFTNEISRIAEASGIDARAVMDIVTSDTKLNVSPAYLRPGFAFGGSCLPKDVRALCRMARVSGADTPLLSSLIPSNERHIESALVKIIGLDVHAIGMLGLAFKSNTDDLRESGAVELAERLIGKGFDLRIFDPAVNESRLMGANKAFIEKKLPHLSKLLTDDTAAFLRDAGLIVVTHGAAEFKPIIAKARNIPIIDLSGLFTKEIASLQKGVS